MSYTALYSRRSFNFPAGPPAAGDATLTWDWLSVTCNGLASTSSIAMVIGGVRRDVGADSTIRSCVWEVGQGAVSAADINAARDAAGVIAGSAIADPSCAPGIGCAFQSDPLLNDIALRYAAVRPSARLACPATVALGATATLDAGASTAGFGGISRWDFAVDGVAVGNGLAPSYSQVFATPGLHTVTVTVTDGFGLVMADACAVEVGS